MANALYDDSIRHPDMGSELTDARFGDHSPNSPNPIAARVELAHENKNPVDEYHGR